MRNVVWLLRFAGAATGRLAVSILARTLGQLLGMIVLALPVWGIAQLAIGSDHGGRFIAGIIGLTVLAAVAKAALRYLEQLTGHLAAFSLLGEMRVWLLDRLIPQAPAATDKLGAARIYQIAVRDVDRIEVFFAHTIAPAITAVIVPVAAVVAAAQLANGTVAIVLAAVLLASVLLLATTGHLGESARATASNRAAIAAHIADTARLRDEIRMYDAQQLRVEQLDQLDRNLAKQLRLGGRNAGLRAGMTDLRVWAGTLLLLAIALVTIDGAPITALPGALAAVTLVIGSAPSVDAVVRLANSLPAGIAATGRVRELASGQTAVAEPAAPESAAPESGTEPEPNGSDEHNHAAGRVEGTTCGGASGQPPALEFAEVTFGYTDSNTILNGVSFAVPIGASVGIVGVSGSGKSTIARLAQRYWDPHRGQVRINGIDARDLPTRSVCELVAVAEQDAFVLDATIRENLLVGAPNATSAAIERACTAAQLELKLDTRVGRRGASLSGGQRQRLAIARTLLRLDAVDQAHDSASSHAQRTPRILILDEATSAQDPLMQAKLVESLRTLGHTLVAIAHRLESLRDLDEIIVLEAGKIVQRGSWDALSVQPGAFRELLLAQQLD